MNLKYKKQEIEAKIGIESFYQDVQICKNYEELLEVTNHLIDTVYKVAAPKNNRINKSLKVFSQYQDDSYTRESRVHKEVYKNKEKTYRNYIPQILLLSKKNSIRKTAQKVQELYNIKVSRETIRQIINGSENV